MVVVVVDPGTEVVSVVVAAMAVIVSVEVGPGTVEVKVVVLVRRSNQLVFSMTAQ